MKTFVLQWKLQHFLEKDSRKQNESTLLFPAGWGRHKGEKGVALIG